MVELVDEVVIREDAGRRELLTREEAEDLRHRDRLLGAASRGLGTREHIGSALVYIFITHRGGGGVTKLAKRANEGERR